MKQIIGVASLALVLVLSGLGLARAQSPDLLERVAALEQRMDGVEKNIKDLFFHVTTLYDQTHYVGWVATKGCRKAFGLTPLNPYKIVIGDNPCLPPWAGDVVPLRSLRRAAR